MNMQASIFGGYLEPSPAIVQRALARPWENKHAAMQMACDGEGFKPGFDQWLNDNWPIFVRFTEEADKLRNKGRPHYSARTIAEVIRHETALSDSDRGFKINDHWTPSMARLYVALCPDAAGFFETRARLQGAPV